MNSLSEKILTIAWYITLTIIYILLEGGIIFLGWNGFCSFFPGDWSISYAQSVSLAFILWSILPCGNLYEIGKKRE